MVLEWKVKYEFLYRKGCDDLIPKLFSIPLVYFPQSAAYDIKIMRWHTAVLPFFTVIDSNEIVYRDYIDISVAVATPKVQDCMYVMWRNPTDIVSQV